MNKSVWSETASAPKFDKLNQNVSCDVLVVGGGIAGVLTARLLKDDGYAVIVTEGGRVGGGITKNTTAVLSAQHDTLYADLIEMHGKEKAKAYLDANLEAVEDYARLSETVDCDFVRKPSFLYSVENDLKYEFDALRSLGYAAEYKKNSALPFAIKSAVEFPDMAEFHPLKFLYGLAKDLTIYENTFIEDVQGHTAFTKDGLEITFKKAVITSHFPFINRRGLFFAKMFQKRSYVIAFENAGDVGGTYIDDTEKGFYFRNYDNLLLIGAGDARTGGKSNAFEQIRSFAKRYYPEAVEKYVWANQDCVTLDSMPYVGEYGGLEDVYVSTGFNLWGMTSSMVGAKILRDAISGKENKYYATFNSRRSIMRKQLFVNIGCALLNVLIPTVKRCPHMGCALKYNKLEHSWDCSCHGSRFDEEGRLIDNPAQEDANV